MLSRCRRPPRAPSPIVCSAGIHAVGAQYFRIIGPSYPFLGISMVVALLVAAVVCTQALGLGERAVFTTIAVGNVVSAVGLIALFLVTERRLRAGLAP